jgi:hypothetical protein
MVDIVVGDRTLDLGLNALHAEATHIYVCKAGAIAAYADVLSLACGAKNFGVNNCFAVPAAGSPSGRIAASTAVTDGVITTSGTVVQWAAVDSVNSRLLGQGLISGSGVAATVGQSFTLASFNIHLFGAAAATGTPGWNTADKGFWNGSTLDSSKVTISGTNNVTMLADAATGGGVRSLTSHKTGKYYVEVHIDVAPANYALDIGFTDSSRTFDPNNYNVGSMFLTTNGLWYDVGTDAFSTLGVGDTLGFIIDFDNKYIWIVGSPSSGVWGSWNNVNGTYVAGYGFINPAAPLHSMSFSNCPGVTVDKFIYALGIGTSIGGVQGGCTLKLAATDFINPNWAINSPSISGYGYLPW